MGTQAENVVLLHMTRKTFDVLFSDEETQVKRRQLGARIRMTRLEIDENQTRFAEEFKVLNNRWRQWEEGGHTADLWVMAELCDRYNVTMDWLVRGHVETLPPVLQSKLFRRYPELLDEVIARGAAVPYVVADPNVMTAPKMLPQEPASGRRRKPRKKVAAS